MTERMYTHFEEVRIEFHVTYFINSEWSYYLLDGQVYEMSNFEKNRMYKTLQIDWNVQH